MSWRARSDTPRAPKGEITRLGQSMQHILKGYGLYAFSNLMAVSPAH